MAAPVAQLPQRNKTQCKHTHTHTHTHIYIYIRINLFGVKESWPNGWISIVTLPAGAEGSQESYKSEQQSRRPFYYRTRCLSLSLLQLDIYVPSAQQNRTPAGPKGWKALIMIDDVKKKKKSHTTAGFPFVFSNHFEIFETNKSERIFLIVFKLDRDSCSRPNFKYIFFQ